MSRSALDHRAVSYLGALRRSPTAFRSQRYASFTTGHNAEDTAQQQEVDEPEARKRKRPTKPSGATPGLRGWASTLNTKALGQTQSILVLRDAGRPSPKQEEAAAAHPAEEDGSLGNMMSMLTEQPGSNESDVTGALDNIWKSLTRPGGRRAAVNALSAEKFDRVLDEISSSFSKAQLVRYLNKGRQAQQGAVPKRPAAAASGVGKTTRLTAELIVREIWQLQTQEELAQQAQVDVNASADVIELLVQQQGDSVLKQISQAFDVRISIDQSAKTLSTIGTQTQAYEASNSLREAIANVHREDISLRDLFGLSTRKAAVMNRVRDICRTCGCQMELRSDTSEVSILALNKSELDRFRRAIFLLSELKPGEDRIFTQGGSNEEDLSALDAGHSMHERATCLPATRLCSRGTLQYDEEEATAESTGDLTEVPISTSLFQDALEYLLPEPAADGLPDGALWGLLKQNLGARDVVTATLGEVGAVPAGFIKRQTKASQATSGLHSSGTLFVPRSTGLLNAIGDHFGEHTPLTSSDIQVTLVPSPWHSQPVQPLKPELRLALGVSSATRQVAFKSLSMMLDQKRALLRLPRHNTDLQMSKSGVIDFEAADVDVTHLKSLQALLRDIELSASGYSKSSASAFVEVDLGHLVRDVFGHKSSTYFISRIDMVESLEFDFDGFKVVLRHADSGSVLGQSEALSLVWEPTAMDLQGEDQGHGLPARPSPTVNSIRRRLNELLLSLRQHGIDRERRVRVS